MRTALHSNVAAAAPLGDGKTMSFFAIASPPVRPDALDLGNIRSGGGAEFSRLAHRPRKSVSRWSPDDIGSPTGYSREKLPGSPVPVQVRFNRSNVCQPTLGQRSPGCSRAAQFAASACQCPAIRLVPGAETPDALVASDASF